jgi:transcriptional regulator with XRE-family HTH domain
MPTIHEIGNAVRLRRTEMGLTQADLARASGLSRSTINAVETHNIGNLSITKAEELLEAIGLTMSISPASPRAPSKAPPSRTALERAAATASVSYSPTLTDKQLERALLKGEASDNIKPHLRALLDEAPMSLLAKVVEEIHLEKGIERSEIWRLMRSLAHELKCFRLIWK